MQFTDGTILYLRTVQAHIFALLNEALKDILFEVNFEFTKDSLVIKDIDSSQCQFVHLHLDGSKFDNYFCKEPSIVLGIDMIFLHKLLKGVSNDDILVFSLNENNRSNLKIQIHNTSKQIIKEYSLKLLDIDDYHEIQLPSLDNTNTVCAELNIETTKFKSICKELGFISDTVTISCSGNELRFECSSASASGAQIIELSEKNYNNEPNDEIITGIFSLKTLYQFTKFGTLSNYMTINLANDKPLKMTYACFDIGSISLYLAPFLYES